MKNNKNKVSSHSSRIKNIRNYDVHIVIIVSRTTGQRIPHTNIQSPTETVLKIHLIQNDIIYKRLIFVKSLTCIAIKY